MYIYCKCFIYKYIYLKFNFLYIEIYIFQIFKNYFLKYNTNVNIRKHRPSFYSYSFTP